MNESSTHFADLASAAMEGSHPKPGTMAWLSEGVLSLLHGECESFDQALGLNGPAPGMESVTTVYRRELRNQLICEAYRLSPGDSFLEKRKALTEELKRFERRSWIRWRHLKQPPDGTPPLRVALFRALKLSGGNLPGSRRLADIVKNGNQLLY